MGRAEVDVLPDPPSRAPIHLLLTFPALPPSALPPPHLCSRTLLQAARIVSSWTDQFTDCVKTDPHDTLVHHMVDVQKATADCREASEKKHTTSSQTNRFSKQISNRSPVQKRLSTVSRLFITYYLRKKILSCNGYCNATSFKFAKIFSAMAHCNVKSIDSIKKSIL